MDALYAIPGALALASPELSRRATVAVALVALAVRLWRDLGLAKLLERWAQRISPARGGAGRHTIVLTGSVRPDFAYHGGYVADFTDEHKGVLLRCCDDEEGEGGGEGGGTLQLLRVEADAKRPPVFVRGGRAARLAGGVTCTSAIDEVSRDGARETRVTTTLTLPAARGSIQDLKRFALRCGAEYVEGRMRGQLERHLIFELRSVDAARGAVFAAAPFRSTKTFDNLFFPDRSRLLARVAAFERGDGEHARLGLPHTLGLLLHGPPGCGKTSCIKALANLTGRHVVRVYPALVDTLDKLKAVFGAERLGDAVVPMERRLYVIEEADCSGWEFLKRRREGRRRASGGAASPPSRAGGSDAENNDAKGEGGGAEGGGGAAALRAAAEALLCAKKGAVVATAARAPPGQLTLGGLLEVLDGVDEMSGRMLVMTTNHPEALDPALTRPGRVDLAVRFGPLDAADVLRLHAQWFPGAPPPGPEAAAALRDGALTQAEVGAAFMEAQGDAEEAWRRACQSSSTNA